MELGMATAKSVLHSFALVDILYIIIICQAVNQHWVS